MEEPPAKETSEPAFNKLDLGQLQDFRFGTQWTEVKPVTGPRRESGRDREQRRPGPGPDERPSRGDAGGEARRDRRGFRRPAGPAPGGDAPLPTRGGPDRPGRVNRSDRPPYDERPPRHEGGEREWRSGPRMVADHRPYQSPIFNVACYPEDTGFAALVKAMRASCRTFELFEIVRLILDKNDRFVVVVPRNPPVKSPPAGAPAAPATAAGATGDKPAPAAAAPGGTPPVEAKARRSPSGGHIFVSVPDGLPFETEDAVVAHVMSRHFDRFFDTTVVEVEPPRGSFPFINRCTLSGELLGPPNYHLYAQIVQQHHAARFSRMPFERYRERIETVRDPAVVNQWLEKMKKVTRYTWKLGAEGEPAATAENLDDARALLLAKARDKVVKTVESARFHGKALETVPPGEIRRAVEGHLERQRRFPLDTANALRGRLRREGFTIFKKGSKGVSYVCAVKRKFRTPGQVMADSIGALMAFLEANPMTPVKELPLKFLGITPPPMPPPQPLSMSNPPLPAADAAPAPESTGGAASATPAPAAPAPAPEHPLAPEQQEKLKRLSIDLRWLVTEGYVTEFGDGRLFAPPPMAEPKAKSAGGGEEEEHDSENFPEAPISAETPPPAGQSAEGTAKEEVAAEPEPPTAPEPEAVTAPAAAAPATTRGEPTSA